MTQAKPLLALIDDLRVDVGEQAAYARDPEGYLASQGWAELDPVEFREALGFARESMSLDVAVTIPDPPPTDAEGSLTDAVDAYLGAVAAVDDVEADLEAFGADATPFEPDISDDDIDGPALDHDLDAPFAGVDGDEALEVDLGPVADDDDDDDEPDDDLVDL